MTSLITQFPFIAENSNATPGLFNRAYQVIQDNFVTIQSTVTTLSSQISAGGTVAVPGEGRTTPTATSYLSTNASYNVVDYGALTTGASGITTAQSVASAAGRGIVVPFQPSKISASITLTVPVRIEPGAPLTTASGATITITGPLDAGPYRIFASGTKVDFTGNRSIRAFLPEWWGATGDGTTDDSAALQAMFDAVPFYAYCRAGTQNANYSITTTIVNRGKAGVIFDSGRHAGYGDTSVPSITWAGSAGEIMFALDRCRFAEISGFNFISGQSGADICIALDGYATYNYRGVVDGSSLGIGSACRVRRNRFIGSNTSNFRAISIAEAIVAAGQPNNQEYHVITENVVEGGQKWAASSVSVSASSIGLVILAAGTGWTSLTSLDVGKRMRVAGAGAGGRVHDTTIATVIDATHATLTVSAFSNATTTLGIKGTGLGDGTRIAASANAKRIGIHDNQFNNLKYGVNALGGGFQAHRNSFYGNEVNLKIGNMSEPTIEHGTNTEQSRVHLESTNGSSFLEHSATGGRYDPSNCVTAYINHLASEGGIAYHGCSTDASTATGGRFVYSAAAGKVKLDGIYFGSSGIATALIEDESGSSIERHNLLKENSPADWRRHTIPGGSGMLVAGEGDATRTGGAFRAIGLQRGSDQFPIGVEGYAKTAPGAGFHYEAIAVRGTTGEVGDGGVWGAVYFVALDGQLPQQDSSGAGIYKATGVRIKSPALTGGATIANTIGVEIQSLTTTGASGVIAIDQQGASDVNKFAGTIYTASGISSAATVNLHQGALLSMRTLAASAITASAANTNVRADELVLTIGGASGASLCIHSGGTVYIFSSALSAKAT